MEPVGPRSTANEPRFANIGTFARLPRLDQVGQAEIAILGAPFDAGTSYRPGARFGPLAIRNGSQLLRPFDPALAIRPFSTVQVADAGDLVINPYSIAEAVESIAAGARAAYGSAGRLLVLGGDHTVALPLIRAASERFGRLALVHFDAHLDTWDTYFGAPYTHGTPFRRAFEEGLLAQDASVHAGIRGPLYGQSDLDEDSGMGFEIVTADEIALESAATLAERIRSRTAEHPVYLSIDIDVLDPSAAPGTGTPEAGGPSSAQVLRLLRALASLPIVGADVVEVSPSYDHAEITAIAASHIAYTTIGLMALAASASR